MQAYRLRLVVSTRRGGCFFLPRCLYKYQKLIRGHHVGGRPPKPVEQHKLDGTYQKCRHQDRVQVTEKITTIEPPETLTDEAKRTWETVIPVLCKAGLVSQADAPELFEAFTAYGIAQQFLHKGFEAGGVDFILTLGRSDKDPFREYLLYMERFDKIMWKFGVTPVERNKIHRAPDKKEDDDSFIRNIIGNG